MLKQIPLFIAASAILAGGLTTPVHADSRDATKTRLRRGEVVVKTTDVKGRSFPKILAMAVVKAPPSKLWEVIGDCMEFKGNLPRIVNVKRLKRKGNKERCKVEVSIPLLSNLTAVTDSVLTADAGKKYVRKWKLVKGDYKKNSGAWTLMPFESPDQTLIVYQADIIPKIEIPEKIQKAALRNTLPGMFRMLRRKMADRPDKPKVPAPTKK